MKTILLKLMFMISSLISFMNTPMTMGVMLLAQTFLSSIFLSKMMVSSWMTMIMFLMLIGGLLILFMYMSSIASNEKFTMNMKMLIVLTIIVLPMEELMLNNQMAETQETPLSVETLAMAKMYNNKSMVITLLMFCYLLLTMIVVTKIIKIFKGPLRSND